MKIFKPLILALLIAFATLSGLRAQDIGISAINGISNGDTLYLGTRTSFGWTLEVKGNDFPQGTGFGIRVVIEGQAIDPYGQGFSFQQDLSSGQTLSNEQIGLPPITMQTLPANFDTGQTRLCIFTESSEDVDRSNDTTCVDVYIKKQQWDIGFTAINTPEPNTEVDIDAETGFNLTLENFSDAPLPAGTQFPFGIRVANTNFATSTWLALDQDIGANSTVSFTLNLTLPEDLPQGEHELCFTTLWSEQEYGIDPNSQNDETCEPFVLNDPNISSVKAQDVVKGLKLHPNPVLEQSALTYYLTSPTNVRLTIHDLTGKTLEILVDENQSAGRQSISFNRGNLETGMYLYRLQNGQNTQTGKFLVQ